MDTEDAENQSVSKELEMKIADEEGEAILPNSGDGVEVNVDTGDGEEANVDNGDGEGANVDTGDGEGANVDNCDGEAANGDDEAFVDDSDDEFDSDWSSGELEEVEGQEELVEDVSPEPLEEEDVDVSPEDIDSMLEAGLPENYRRSKPQFSVRELVVLEEKGKNSLEALPEGWLEIRHCSGVPVYLHRTSRVCTLAKPYCLGPSSVRKHLIPLSAVPCLSYKRALQREEEDLKNQPGPSKRMRTDDDNNTDKENPNTQEETFVPLPMAKVETAEEANTLFAVQPLELREYCQNLFKFKTIQSKRFHNWTAKRQHTKMQKRLKVQGVNLPDGIKWIKFPVLKPLVNRKGDDYLINPKGKSSVCILHEYIQHALRQQPVYQFKELEHASAPYSATVIINGIRYGTGYGTSKKQAKSNAAKETLVVLIPQIKDTLDPVKKNQTGGMSSDIVFTECFGQIELDDPRIATLCQNISEPTPYTLLLTCIQRNFGKVTDGSLQFEMVSTIANQKIKFKMTFKEHVVEIIAPNKKEGKQVASQTMLAKIHPHIQNFGAFIRLYGTDSIKSCKEKKQDQQEVTELQSKASANQPNYAILAKLREEMMKLSNPDLKDAKDKFINQVNISRAMNEKGIQTEADMMISSA